MGTGFYGSNDPTNSVKALKEHTTSVHNTTQNSSDNLPSYLQTNIIAQMLSIGGEGAGAR